MYIINFRAFGYKYLMLYYGSMGDWWYEALSSFNANDLKIISRDKLTEDEYDTLINDHTSKIITSFNDKSLELAQNRYKKSK